MPERVFTEFTTSDHWAGRQQAGTLWVADFDARPQAFLAATAHVARLHINEFAVAQAHQGKGVGRRMLHTVVDWAREHDYASISLTTFRGVPFNGPFYASAGFRMWDDPPADVRAILAGEAARGFTDRCAMRLDL